MRKWILLSLLGIGSVAWAGEIADLYQKTVSPDEVKKDMQDRPRVAGAQDPAHGISEIGLERTRCYGTCPAYSVVIKSDGSLRYNGIAFVDRKGEATGTINPWQFNKLASLIDDVDYMSLKSTYSTPVTDNPTVFTTVVMNGKRKVISNYAQAGPARLWAVEQLIDQALSKATWDKKPENK